MNQTQLLQRMLHEHGDEPNGSIAGEIIRVIDEGRMLPRSTAGSIEDHDRLLSEIYRNAWNRVNQRIFEVLNPEMKKDRKQEAPSPGIPGLCPQAFIILITGELKGVIADDTFFDFFDPLCNYPFPDGIEEIFRDEVINFARVAVSQESEKVVNSLN